MRLQVSVKVVLLVCLVLTNAAGKIINSFVSLLAEPGLQVSALVRVSGRLLSSHLCSSPELLTAGGAGEVELARVVGEVDGEL